MWCLQTATQRPSFILLPQIRGHHQDGSCLYLPEGQMCPCLRLQAGNADSVTLGLWTTDRAYTKELFNSILACRAINKWMLVTSFCLPSLSGTILDNQLLKKTHAGWSNHAALTMVTKQGYHGYIMTLLKWHSTTTKLAIVLTLVHFSKPFLRFFVLFSLMTFFINKTTTISGQFSTPQTDKHIITNTHSLASLSILRNFQTYPFQWS